MTFNATTTEKNTAPLVSVLMNCFNGEKYLREAINSVIAQTYTNWEIIFWDNQSTDQSAEIFKSYADSRLKYFHAPTHTLLYEARNFAIEKASGEFIGFLDVDDWWESDKLEKQIQLFEDTQVGLVYGNFWLVNERKNKKKQIQHKRILPKGDVLNQLLENYVVGLVTIVIRRAAIETHKKIFDSRYQIVGDVDIVIRIAAEWKFDCIQSPVASYRWHGENVSLLDSPRTISEMETWFSEIKQHPIIGTQTGLTSILDKIAYLKIMHTLIQGKRLKAISLFRRYPLNTQKIRLLFALLMPLEIIKALRN